MDVGNTDLIGMLESPSIDTVVGSIEASLWEPDDVTGREASRSNGLEWAVPMKGLPGHLRSSL